MTPILIALLLAASTGQTSVPTAENFAACNAEARDAVKRPTVDSPAASPIMKDEQRAGAARRGESDRSDDPQLTGIDAEGAKNPAYQAAYRTCMRKSGF
ncbi:MAG TPA: hypothetical protein VIE36_23185 [Methylomirabilota bacterium]|jgi:hypothetical protein